MQSIDMLLDTTREFLHQSAAFLPRLVLAFAVVAALDGFWPRRCGLQSKEALRAVNFGVLTERAGTDHFLQQRRPARRYHHAIRTVRLLGGHFGDAHHRFQRSRCSPTSPILLQRVELFAPEGAGGHAGRGSGLLLRPLRRRGSTDLLHRCADSRLGHPWQDCPLPHHDLRLDDRLQPWSKWGATSCRERFSLFWQGWSSRWLLHLGLAAKTGQQPCSNAGGRSEKKTRATSGELKLTGVIRCQSERLNFTTSVAQPSRPNPSIQASQRFMLPVTPNFAEACAARWASQP